VQRPAGLAAPTAGVATFLAVYMALGAAATDGSVLPPTTLFGGEDSTAITLIVIVASVAMGLCVFLVSLVAFPPRARAPVGPAYSALAAVLFTTALIGSGLIMIGSGLIISSATLSAALLLSGAIAGGIVFGVLTEAARRRRERTGLPR
jgi:hypothetical protein